jgi:hypothetical protein
MDQIKARLEYLRGEIIAERISYGEIEELKSLACYIAPDDVVLLEWAGIPEIKRIQVTAIGAREKMEDWIANRGGVQVWNNINMSNPGAGPMFTPANKQDGTLMDKPSWSVERGEVIQNIQRFQFVKSWHEIKRFHVAIRRGSQGFSMKLTDGSTGKVRRFQDNHPEASYRFDYETQECVFEVPEYEG